MLAPLILPMQITFGVMVAVIVVCLLLASRWKWHRGRTFERALFCSVLLYIPSCMGVMAAIDPLRYGMFYYRTSAEVQANYRGFGFPDGAEAIALNRRVNGFQAAYLIDEQAINDFINALWADPAAAQSVRPRELSDSDARFLTDFYRAQFAKMGWITPEKVILLMGPVGADGSGTAILYERSARMAYQSTASW